jgi:hypothetical protein
MNPENKKLRGGSDSELTRFKKLWRDSMAESARDFWRSVFVSDATQAAIRSQIYAELKINLTYDGQLNSFRDWEMDQRERDLQAERMQENEKRLREEHPDWTKDQLRDALMTDAYLEARATGDFKLGLATVRQDRGLMAISLERDKFKEALRTKIDAGLDALFEEVKGNKEALDLFQRFKAVVTKATA